MSLSMWEQQLTMAANRPLCNVESWYQCNKESSSIWVSELLSVYHTFRVEPSESTTYNQQTYAILQERLCITFELLKTSCPQSTSIQHERSVHFAPKLLPSPLLVRQYTSASLLKMCLVLMMYGCGCERLQRHANVLCWCCDYLRDWKRSSEGSCRMIEVDGIVLFMEVSSCWCLPIDRSSDAID